MELDHDGENGTGPHAHVPHHEAPEEDLFADARRDRKQCESLAFAGRLRQEQLAGAHSAIEPFEALGACEEGPPLGSHQNEVEDRQRESDPEPPRRAETQTQPAPGAPLERPEREDAEGRPPGPQDADEVEAPPRSRDAGRRGTDQAWKHPEPVDERRGEGNEREEHGVEHGVRRRHDILPLWLFKKPSLFKSL